MPNKTILFADNSVTMRTVMEKTFTSEAYDVTVVPSGEAAVKTAQEMNPDIIIADAGMAGVTGYDVCKSIREDSSLTSTPVIIMSGVSSPYDESRGTEVGVDEYVKKPFDTTQLIEKVGQLIEEAAASPPPSKPSEPPLPQKEKVTKPKPPVRLSTPVPIAPKPEPIAPKPAPVRPEKPPVQSPLASQKPVKDTMEFGHPASIPSLSSVGEQLTTPPKKAEKEPDVEPIEIDEKEPEINSFQVSTLAEMAQMDESGMRMKPQLDDAIDLIENETPIPAPAAQLPIAEAVQEQARMAAETVVEQVEGLSTDQVDSIQSLTKDVIEKVVWEIVPELAEAIIKEELAKLLEE